MQSRGGRPFPRRRQPVRMSQAPVSSKPSRPRLSLERRIAVAILAASLAVLTAASGAFVLVHWRTDVAAARKMRSDAVAAAVAAVGEPRTAQGAGQVLTLLTATPELAFARVEDAGGRILAQRRYAPGPRRGEHAYPLPHGGRVVTAHVPVRVERFLPELLAVCGALFFVAAGLAVLLGRALARRVIEPVDALAGFMREVTGAGGFDRRAPPSQVWEVARLTDSFNDLLGRLQANHAALRRTLGELTTARDAAQAASVLKTQFLANISHEIRTPLNGVLAMTEVMALGELDAEQRARLTVVRESGEALLAILNDVLDVSKIEAGRMQLEESDFDAPAVIRRACEGFSAALEDKGLAFALHFDPRAESWRRGDPVRLRQVLMNLLSNAVKFTPAGAVSVHVRPLPGADGLVIEVEDTGLGVEPGQAAHLFEKFTQADSSTTRRFGGTGLGLAICRDLVELMDGSLVLEPRVGGGSVFRALLPLPTVSPPGAAPIGGEASPRSEPARLRVLAAEDNPTNQVVISTVMEVFGVGLEVVGDGREAVEAWRRGGFDLVLMDVQMPEMDGLAATRAIRAEEAARGLARTPIVALSANALTHQVREYLAAGMDDHVAKPIELGRLQETMERVLAAPRAAAAA